MEGKIWRILLGFAVFCSCFIIGNRLVAAETRPFLPGYENTEWGVTAADGQVVSGLTPQKSAELAQEKGQGIRVRVDSQEVAFSGQLPFIEKGRVLVPLRPLLESEYVQCRVSWQEESLQAVVEDQKGRQVVFQPGESSYKIIEAGEASRIYPLDVPALMKEGRIFLPLRVLLEAFSYRVAWLETEQMVDIQDTHPGWRLLLPSDQWQKLLSEDCKTCPFLNEEIR